MTIPKPTPQSVIAAVARFYRVPVEGVKSRKRDWKLMWPRWVAMELLKRRLKLKGDQVAREFGLQREAVYHATVMYKVRTSDGTRDGQRLKENANRLARQLFSSEMATYSRVVEAVMTQFPKCQEHWDAIIDRVISAPVNASYCRCCGSDSCNSRKCKAVAKARDRE